MIKSTLSPCRGSLLFVILLLHIARPYAKETNFRTFKKANLRFRQWEAISLQFKVWNGFWVRYDTSGNALDSTLAVRNFTRLNPDSVLQSNVYKSTNFSSSDSTQWMYFNSDPPRYVQPLLPNGTVVTMKYPNIVFFFYPTNWGFWGNSQFSKQNGHVSLEKFFIDRFRRVSFAPVYTAKAVLSYLTLVREREHPRKMTKQDVTNTKARRLRKNRFRLNGVWVRVLECIDNDYKYSKSYGFVDNFSVWFPADAKRFAYAFPWGLHFSVPLMIDESNSNIIHSVWKISRAKVIVGTTVYAAGGDFERDCTAVFFKIAM